MRCLSPRTVGFYDDGKTLCWSKNKYSKQFATFPFPCGKCIECRAEQGSTKAVRCVHEARENAKNCFITLTYDNRFLPKDGRLDKRDVQKFIKKLRSRYKTQEIRVVWTGEYGEQLKRPHWHLIIFGWSPDDPQYKYTSDHGDQVFTSPYLGPRDQKELDNFCLPKLHPDRDTKRYKKMLWKKGTADFGSVTYKSASYVCRYALKKLVHGKDQEHDYHPIHNFRNKTAIGRKWIEKYWRDVFHAGCVILEDGSKMAIPRYYVEWLKKNEPEAFMTYVTEVKAQISADLATRQETKQEKINDINWNRLNLGKGLQITELEAKKIIVEDRIKRLQSHLKGDI